MKDLVLIKTYLDKLEADQLRDELIAHGIAALIVTDRAARSAAEESLQKETCFFDVKVPAIDVAKTISFLTSSGVPTLLADDADETPDSSRSAAELELLAENEALRQKLADMSDKYLRSRAEVDNMRRRHERDRQEIRKFSLEAIFKDIIPVLDGFERALPSEESIGPRIDTNQIEESFYKGMVQLRQQMVDVFKKHGLNAIETQGIFDPNLHQAIKTLPSREVQAATVGDEYARGYLLHNRVLRPAMVSVVTPKEDEPQQEATGTPPAQTDKERTLH